jgi:hypothetical protein
MEIRRILADESVIECGVAAEYRGFGDLLLTIFLSKQDRTGTMSDWNLTYFGNMSRASKKKYVRAYTICPSFFANNDNLA